MLNSSGESGHPCLTPLPTFPGSEYSPSILLRFSSPFTRFEFSSIFFTRICCPMYRFPISLLSLQSIPIRLSACSSLLHSTLSNAFHNPQSRYIQPDHSVCSSLLVLLMFLLHP